MVMFAANSSGGPQLVAVLCRKIALFLNKRFSK